MAAWQSCADRLSALSVVPPPVSLSPAAATALATAVTAAGSTHAANQRSGRTGRGGLLWPVSPSLLLFSLIIKCCTESRIPPPRIALRSEQGTTVVAWLTGSAVEVHLHLSCPVRPRASACDRATVRMSCVRVAPWANQPHSCSRCKSGPHQPCGGSAAPSEARR